jgi:hypothetical protein
MQLRKDRNRAVIIFAGGNALVSNDFSCGKSVFKFQILIHAFFLLKTS